MDFNRVHGLSCVRARKQEIDSPLVASSGALANPLVLCVPLPQCLNERLGSQSYLRQNSPINSNMLVLSNPGRSTHRSVGPTEGPT